MTFKIFLVRTRNDCPEATKELWTEAEKYLRQLAGQRSFTWLRQKDDPQDIVQEVLLRALQRFSQFTGRTSGELFAWLKAILINQRRTVRRRDRSPAARPWSLDQNPGAQREKVALPEVRQLEAWELANLREELLSSAALHRLLGPLMPYICRLSSRDALLIVNVCSGLPDCGFEFFAATFGESVQAMRCHYARAMKRVIADWKRDGSPLETVWPYTTTSAGWLLSLQEWASKGLALIPWCGP